jgi:hypothetical protein
MDAFQYFNTYSPEEKWPMCSCGGTKHWFTHLCDENCRKELSGEVEKIIGDLLNEIVDEVENTCLAAIERENAREKPVEDYYTAKYGIVPREWKDEEGNLIGMVYDSNSDETRRLWGTCLVLRMDGESSEEEYDDGDVADYWRHREMGF